MIHDHHPDPSHEAISEAARLAAVLVTVIETLILVSTRDPGRSQQQQERDAKVLKDAMARDRQRYQQTLEPHRLQSASSAELFATWAAATGWRELDADAADAAGRIEQRLNTLHPGAMHRYREAIGAGDDPSVAMTRAAKALAAAPHATPAVSATTDNRVEPHKPVARMAIGVDGGPRIATAAHRRQATASARRR